MSPVRMLRMAGIAEGISFIVLLFVAMPVKYVLQYPVAVRVTGAIHGVLFLVFIPVLFRASAERSWSLRTSLVFFGAALVPFGFLLVDERLKAEIARAGSPPESVTPSK